MPVMRGIDVIIKWYENNGSLDECSTVVLYLYKCMDGGDLVAERVMEIVLKSYTLITDLQLGHNHHSSCDLTHTHTQCFVALVIF